MKLTARSSGIHMPQLQLSQHAREILLTLCCTLIPYAIAAIGVFIYHEQFPM
jgi:hypothetical protein